MALWHMCNILNPNFSIAMVNSVSPWKQCILQGKTRFLVTRTMEHASISKPAKCRQTKIFFTFVKLSKV